MSILFAGSVTKIFEMMSFASLERNLGREYSAFIIFLYKFDVFWSSKGK